MVRSGIAVDAIDMEREFAEASLGGRGLPSAFCALGSSVSFCATGGGAGPDGCRLVGMTRPVLVVCELSRSAAYEVIDMARSLPCLSGTTRPCAVIGAAGWYGCWRKAVADVWLKLLGGGPYIGGPPIRAIDLDR